ncbi:MAG: TVP38/TMEM64 family protein [Gammaproteobacteria bacterium]|nr:TVP38/TMEM64 family protein [Gammaproteobacteria bacterium]
MSALKPRIFLNGLLLIASLVGVAYLFEVAHVSSMLDKTWIDSEVRGKGMTGELLFLGMGVLATAIGVPRQAISFLAGYAFDVAFGTLFGVLATAGGCFVTFCYARWFGRGLVAARFSERIRRIDGFIHDNTLSMTVLIRLLPAGSNLVTNLAAGVAHVRAVPFVLGSALGYIPQTLVFALVGSGISLDPLFRIGLGVALFFVSGVLGIYLFRKFRHGRHLDEQLEHELGVDD